MPDAVTEAFTKLPKVMGRADAHAGQMTRAVIDLAEAVMLDGRENEISRRRHRRDGARRAHAVQ